MKLIIPSNCQIGAHTFKIRWSPKILDLMECKGGSEYMNDHIIRLLPGRPITQLFQTLVHEGIHQVDHVFGAGGLSEDQVRVLSGGICQFLLSLGIEEEL